MAGLRYGCIAVNTPGVLPFGLTRATWGGYPGTTLEVRVETVGDPHDLTSRCMAASACGHDSACLSALPAQKPWKRGHA